MTSFMLHSENWESLVNEELGAEYALGAAPVEMFVASWNEKYPDENTYHPVMKANEFEEGTGHHSMIKYKGQWYAIYHARDIEDDGLAGDRRNARICKLNVNDGIITAETYKDHI